MEKVEHKKGIIQVGLATTVISGIFILSGSWVSGMFAANKQLSEVKIDSMKVDSNLDKRIAVLENIVTQIPDMDKKINALLWERGINPEKINGNTL